MENLPPLTRTSPDSPGSNVLPLIIAVRLGGLVMPFSAIDDESTSSGFTFRTGASVMDFGKNGFLPSLGLDGILNTARGIAASSLVELVFSTDFWLSPKAALTPPRARERTRRDPVFAGFSFISNT